MASQNKKNKAKNSFLYNGAENHKGEKWKRTMYFIKADRIKNKRECRDENC